MRYLGNIDMDNMSEEEIDELYRPKRMNGRKSLAPLFVYLILKENSNWNVHLTQKDILKKLEQEPYEIVLERKALGRILNQLGDSDVNIITSQRYGYWYDHDEKCCSNF